MREELHENYADAIFDRITPACAGRTLRCKILPVRLQDHPRVCGKNSVTRTMEKAKRGSPPRVREEPVRIVDFTRGEGITPACAGRTRPRIMSYGSLEDHPRVCGKNFKRKKRCRRSQGSPPRVREELCKHRSFALFLRITPACAGRTMAVFR